MELISLKNVSKVFGKGNMEVKALDNINLEIQKGEMIAIVGASGSGKTTLLNIIGLLDKQTEGEYYLNNIDINSLEDRELALKRNKEIGFIVQNFALIKSLNVYDNIEIPLYYAKVKSQIRKEKIYKIAKELGIEAKLKSEITNISGGQAQRVAIARALVNDAQIIIADEPTGALDRKTGNQIIDLLEEINKKGKTVIIVTHDEKVANRCKRIIEIEDGKILNI